ncbi:hypothetical protein [Streptomyces sp. NPDC017940]|uniref:hypothetical protein n=1 Tax=Streptomyces sp. NPDC017940 TaxID=3365017 RepID=UPI003787514E
MLRHEFQPGRLVAGVFLALAGLVYAGDSGGLWDTPWFAIIPIVAGGLFLAAATAAVAHLIRRGRGPRAGTRADARTGSPVRSQAAGTTVHGDLPADLEPPHRLDTPEGAPAEPESTLAEPEDAGSPPERPDRAPTSGPGAL